MNNGGFSQFFCNSSVEFAPMIVNSLKATGHDGMADLSQKAIDILGVDSLEAGIIEERMDPDDEELEEALAYALFEYIKNNRDSTKLNANS